jgi:hypothetical protein
MSPLTIIIATTVALGTYALAHIADARDRLLDEGVWGDWPALHPEMKAASAKSNGEGSQGGAGGTSGTHTTLALKARVLRRGGKSASR